MNIKYILIGVLVVVLIYRLFSNDVKEFFSSAKSPASKKIKEEKNNTTNDINDVSNSDSTRYTDKHVRFNDNIDIFEYDDNLSYSSADSKIIGNDHLDKIVDNLLKTPIIDNNIDDKKFKSCLKSLNNVDKEKMFNELEEEINNKYDKYNNSEYFQDIDRQPLSTNILNSKDTNMNSTNAAINPNCFKEALAEDDNLTIWEKYDKITSNNYKQYDKLDNMVPNNLSPNSWTLGENIQYGSKFDNYSL
jgi:hypothetical protein